MKKPRLIAYWVATIFIASETLAGGLVDLAHGRTNVISGPHVSDIIGHLGYPSYLLVILGVWKVLGGVVLLLPGFARLKEWAYAGVFFELTGAAASWALHGDRAQELIAPLVFASLVIVSWALRPADRMLGVLLPAGSSGARVAKAAHSRSAAVPSI